MNVTVKAMVWPVVMATIEFMSWVAIRAACDHMQCQRLMMATAMPGSLHLASIAEQEGSWKRPVICRVFDFTSLYITARVILATHAQHHQKVPPGSL